MSAARKHTLLVVDDEPHVADSIHDLLRRQFRILKARNAAEGLKVLQEQEVHVIMTDQRMPKITGVEMLTAIRHKHPQAVRILFTGYLDLDALVQAINQGHIFKFLKKPWQPEELESMVHEAVAEYDRIVERAETITRLQEEVQTLQARLRALEEETNHLRRIGGRGA